MYSPAAAANSSLVLTTTARLSTYPLSDDIDQSKDLLIEFTLVPVVTQDLREVASTRLGSSPRLSGADTTVATKPAYRLEGTFQNGERIIVLVQIRPDRVLLVQALPRRTRRISDFEQVLRTIQIIQP